MPSLMPPGLAAQLKSRQEFLDLARFVSLLGRPGDYAPSVAPVIRVWTYFFTPSPDLNPSTWVDYGGARIYSKVDGSLPAAALTSNVGDDPFTVLFSEITVQKRGPVTLSLNDPTGLRFWVDRNEIKDLAGKIHLTEGPHTLTFQIDVNKRGAKDFRAELQTPKGAPTKFQLQTGI